MSAKFQRVEGGLYLRDGLYYCRVRDEGQRTWRGTGTGKLTKARKVLAKWREEQTLLRHGIETPKAALKRQRLTVGEVLAAYVEAGHPTKKMQRKTGESLAGEQRCLAKLRAYFGGRAAVSLTLKDADTYHDWRLAGGYKITRTGKDGQQEAVPTKGGNRAVDLELTVPKRLG